MGASKLETADRFTKPKDLDANSVILFRLPRIFRLTFALKSQPADQFKSTVVKKSRNGQGHILENISFCMISARLFVCKREKKPLAN